MTYDISFVAVLVAALGNMVVGTLWYGPLFGKIWKRYMGFTDEKMKSMPLTAWQAMVGGLVTALLLSYVLAHIGGAFFALDGAAPSFTDALEMAFWMWLGFAVPFTAGSFLWEGKPFSLFVLNAAQWLVSFAVMSSILVLWPWQGFMVY